tara:strand:- start:209 stop:931 length:723 start_codon:yes stop_codon:yes gene_type:complete
MKIKKPIIENTRDFEILMLIKERINYNEALAKKLKIKPSTIIDQLKYLEKRKYIISKREKRFNRKIYSLNYNKFIEDLLLEIRGYILGTLSSKEVSSLKLSSKEITKIMEDNISKASVYTNKLLENKALKGIFMLISIKDMKIDNITTLGELYRNIVFGLYYIKITDVNEKGIDKNRLINLKKTFKDIPEVIDKIEKLNNVWDKYKLNKSVEFNFLKNLIVKEDKKTSKVQNPSLNTNKK